MENITDRWMLRVASRRLKWSSFLFIAPLFAVSPLLGESFVWGFISTNVTHRLPSGRTERVKFVSNVFGYCGSEIRGDTITQDKELELKERIRAVLGDDNFEITYNFVDGGSNTQEAANRKREQDMKSEGYGRHESWECACAYTSRSCRQ